MKLKRISLYLFCSITLLQMLSCSTERIDSVDNLKTYVSLKPYLESKRDSSQYLEIIDYSSMPITGKKGVKIDLGIGKLVLSNGELIDFPFMLELKELYTAKEMIYHLKPTVSYKNAMETRGELFIRAYKVNPTGTESELELNSGEIFTIDIPTDSVSENIKVYYGMTSSVDYNWTDDVSKAGANDGDLYFTAKDSSLEAQIGKLGWINAGYAQNGVNSLAFKSEQDDLTNVEIFAYLPQYRSVLRAFNRQIIGIPNSTTAQVVAMAIDAQGQLYCDTTTTNVTKSVSIPIKLKPISDEQLTFLLDELKPSK